MTLSSALRRPAARLLLAGGGLAGGTGLLAAATPAYAQSPARMYSFRTLDNPADLTFNQLLGINDQGVIAGYFGSGMPASTAPNRGYLLDPYSHRQYANEDYPGAAQTQVIGINDFGTTVGFYANAAGDNFGFVDRGGHFTKVSEPQAAGSARTTQLLGINNEGLAVGFYNDAKGDPHGFEYNTHTGQYNRIMVPGAVSSMATGINDSDDISGIATYPNKATRGYVRMGGTFDTLVAPGSTATAAYGLNDAGAVVGQETDPAGKLHGFVFENGTFMRLDDPNGLGTTLINGINNAGDLVGFYADAAGDNSGFVAAPQYSATPGV